MKGTFTVITSSHKTIKVKSVYWCSELIEVLKLVELVQLRANIYAIKESGYTLYLRWDPLGVR